ncbi:hypothetical protein L228DRAFT_170345 [Xylona heveae TC161]|uniref:Uncharacterized protein n=1 Tax=Xylona heveae (strain CBS 132557 / TC161) TaxID=1328760 RepID=A0A165FSE8_XYLHT|nr:hypothetical protein L228DRAFT_170345 [Xylona heveae TC161]KZF21319.1 hypothetical protein L228DRAFT_170345 [Xylona heveae TC161]
MLSQSSRFRVYQRARYYGLRLLGKFFCTLPSSQDNLYPQIQVIMFLLVQYGLYLHSSPALSFAFPSLLKFFS